MQAIGNEQETQDSYLHGTYILAFHHNLYRSQDQEEGSCQGEAPLYPWIPCCFIFSVQIMQRLEQLHLGGKS